MSYLRQKNTNVVLVTEVEALAEHPALSLYPELFELVEGDAPPHAEYLHFVAEATDGGA